MTLSEDLVMTAQTAQVCTKGNVLTLEVIEELRHAVSRGCQLSLHMEYR